jgi:hypothetical protein
MADQMLDMVSTDQTPSNRGSTVSSISRRRSRIWQRSNFPSSVAGWTTSTDTAWPRSFSSQQTRHQPLHLAGERKGFKPAVAASIQGYNVIHWTNAGMTFWAVLDMNEKELMEFVQDYEAESSHK